MTDLFTLDIMVGYVLPMKDEPCLFPTVTFKLLNFPSLTVHCIPPSEQQELRKKLHSDLLPNKIGIKSSQDRIVFKKGKSCSFKLSKQDAQNLYLPLIVRLNDAWYLPVKELARTCIDILVPHFKRGSVTPPINSSKQVYELRSTNGSKVAMIELSYKLKHIRTDVTGDDPGHKAKLTSCKENFSKEDKSVGIKEIILPQKTTKDMSVNKLLDKVTMCPPPLLYSAISDNEQVKLQSVVEPVTSQDVSQVVWPNGYVHSDPGWNASKEDNFSTVLLPSCPQYAVPPAAQDEVNVSNDQNFCILRTLVKELSAVEQLLKSRGVSPPTQKCADVCVQTESMNSSTNEASSIIDSNKSIATEIVIKKLRRKRKHFIRECCTAKLDQSPAKQLGKVKPRHVTPPSQKKVTSPRVIPLSSPQNKTTSSVLHESRTRNIKIKSLPRQKPPPQRPLDSVVSRVSQMIDVKELENDKQANEEFSVNTSVEHKGDQSKLNLEIHLPTLSKISSTSNISLKQDDAISSTVIGTTAALLTVPTDSVTTSLTPMASPAPLMSASQSVTPMPSGIPLTPASQSEQLTLASSNDDVQSYTNLSLSESTEDVLNQSHISNLMYSAKHLKAALADDVSTKNTSLVTDRDKPSSVEAISLATKSSESVEYKDDFESSDCSSSIETLSSKTS